MLPLAAVLLATPVAIRVANWADFHDRPVGYKGHARPTPYLGGAAVLTGFLLGAGSVGGELLRLAPIVIGAFVLWAVGTMDDRRTVRPGLRVCFEIGAATTLALSGLGWEVFGNAIADLALTAFWVVGLVNAFNLMDNMDGATSTVAVLSSLGVAVLALVLGDPVLAALAFALCGACLGFLPYNLAGPARIFLGDGGSMSIGFVVAATIMALPLGEDVAWQRLLAAVLLAGLPILDTLLVVVSRRRAGISALVGGRDHLTHRLRRRLPSARAVAVVLASVQAALCAAALGVTQVGDFSTALSWGILMAAAATAVATLETQTWAPIRPVVASHEPSSPASDIPAADHIQAEPVLVAAETTAATAALLVKQVTGEAGRTPGDPVVEVPSRNDVGEESERQHADTRPPSSDRPWALRRPPDLVEVVLIAFVGLTCGLSPLLYGFYNLTTWGPIALVLLACLFGLIIARPAVPRPAALVAILGLVLLWAWSLLSSAWAESADQAVTEANRWMLYAAFLAILVLLLRNDRLGRILLGFVTGSVVLLGGYVLLRMLTGSGPELFVGNRLHEPLGYANGQAAYFLLGIWPLIALCERTGRRAVSATALGLATMLAALMLLTETRAVLPAIAVSAAVLVVVVPGRLRRTWILLAIGLGLAVLWAPLTAVFAGVDGVRSQPSDAVTREAAALTLVVSLAAGLAWALFDWLADTARRRDEAWRRLRLAAASGLALVALAAVTAVALNDPVDAVADRVDAFKNLSSADEGTSRFTSTGGMRYDYWRIALNQFRAEPLHGLGAGNYDRTYFLERRTTEDVRQPHSLILQVLGELGVIGVVALVLFLVGVLAAFGRRWLSARANRTDAAMAIAGGGMFISWLVHTSIDWLHLIPGVTGMALCGAAVLLAPWTRRRALPEPTAVRRVVLAGCAVLVLVAAVQLGRSTLAEHNLKQGQEVLSSAPVQALDEADQSLALNDEALSAYYLKAAAHARLNRYEEARGALLAAARREPNDFVTWGLLGDLAVRRGDLDRAAAYYRRASDLNPRDLTLARLAATPPPP